MFNIWFRLIKYVDGMCIVIFLYFYVGFFIEEVNKLFFKRIIKIKK